MARSVITVTSSWVQIASGPSMLTIEEVGSGQLLINNSATDVAAMRFATNSSKAGEQVEQDATEPTWVRADGDGWKLLLDGA